MQAIEILDVRAFMQLLFQTDTFNEYELVSADLKTELGYSIDGHINRDYYEDESENLPLTGHTFLPWSIAKDKIFQLIRGKKTPSRLKIILRVNPEQLHSMLTYENSSLNPNDIDGVFLNILFQEQKLNVICGVSYKIFTLDKGLENVLFDDFVTLLKSNSISIEK